MEKRTIVIDEKVTKEFMAHLLKMVVFCFICAVVFAGLYVLFSVLNNNWGEPLNIVILVVAAFLVVAGLTFLMWYVKGNAQASMFVRTAEYEFLDDYLSFILFRKEEKIEEGKYYYDDMAGYKLTKNYVFLALKNNSYIAVHKTDEVISFLNQKGLPLIKSISVKKRK